MRQKGEARGQLPPLLESEIMALSTLAEEGSTNIYQIQKKTGKAYSLMFNAVKSLEKRGVIKLLEKKPTSKGTRANVYDLTFTGVLTVLARELSPEDTRQRNNDKIRKIIGKYDKWLPLVFGKWSFFQESGVEKTAVLRLRAIVSRLNVERVHFTDFLGYGGPLVPAADIKSLVQWLFYFIGLVPAEGRLEQDKQIRLDVEAWINALGQDKDIVAYLTEELERYQHTLMNLSDISERLKARVIGTNKQRDRQSVDGRQ